MTKCQIIEALKLKPLSIEGGYFSEVYRSNLEVEKTNFPVGCKSASYKASTSIYYLLGAHDASGMHAVPIDETWHFYASSDSGAYVDLIVVSKEGVGRRIKLGARLEKGQVPQFTIPAGYWMGASIAFEGGDKARAESVGGWCLTGATVAPSFEYCDFVKGDAAEIAKSCPEFSSYILKLG